MKCFSLKLAYFIISSCVTAIIIIGGFTVIFVKKDDDGGYNWARELISMSLTLWMPSPAEYFKDIVMMKNHNEQRQLDRTYAMETLRSTVMISSQNKEQRLPIPAFDYKILNSTLCDEQTEINPTFQPQESNKEVEVKPDVEKCTPVSMENSSPNELNINNPNNDSIIKIQIELID